MYRELQLILGLLGRVQSGRVGRFEALQYGGIGYRWVAEVNVQGHLGPLKLMTIDAKTRNGGKRRTVGCCGDMRPSCPTALLPSIALLWAGKRNQLGFLSIVRLLYRQLSFEDTWNFPTRLPFGAMQVSRINNAFARQSHTPDPGLLLNQLVCISYRMHSCFRSCGAFPSTQYSALQCSTVLYRGEKSPA
ncbi:hypothetical protein BDZ91DRAFT_343607 [Kalaharituber pfeilii]|nr:hypothetical protein BDZ91DRAFT_343607 [Kalaharituber pfeilii]